MTKKAEGSLNRRPCFKYVIDSHHVLLRVIPSMLPYSLIKRPQLEAADRFLQSRASRSSRSAYNEVELRALYDIRSLNALEGVPSYKGERLQYLDFCELLRRNPATYNVVEWNPTMDSQLGTDTDGAVARALGLKRAQVQARRSSLGIPVFKRSLRLGWRKPDEAEDEPDPYFDSRDL